MWTQTTQNKYLQNRKHRDVKAGLDIIEKKRVSYGKCGEPEDAIAQKFIFLHQASWRGASNMQSWESKVPPPKLPRPINKALLRDY